MLIKFSKQIGIQGPGKHLRWNFFCKSLLGSEANWESCQTSKMELFVKLIKNEKPFTIFVKSFILDVWQGFEYASELPSKVTDVSFLNQLEYQNWQIT